MRPASRVGRVDAGTPRRPPGPGNRSWLGRGGHFVGRIAHTRLGYPILQKPHNPAPRVRRNVELRNREFLGTERGLRTGHDSFVLTMRVMGRWRVAPSPGRQGRPRTPAKGRSAACFDRGPACIELGTAPRRRRGRTGVLGHMRTGRTVLPRLPPGHCGILAGSSPPPDDSQKRAHRAQSPWGPSYASTSPP